MLKLTAASLGDPTFRLDYGIKFAYLAGAMYQGIASQEMIVALGRAGLMGYLGTGGLDLADIEASIRYVQSELREGQAYGMNLLANPERPDLEDRTVDLFLKYGIRCVEAAAFIRVTRSLVRYRLSGIRGNVSGAVKTANRIVAKVSRPEVAAVFMQPAPWELTQELLASGQLTRDEADLAREVPMADDICVEADSGGHTDRGVAYTLLPAMLMLRDRMMVQYSYGKRIRVGAAGGIGTPYAAAAAFTMGADFILTGSINQCTREAATSQSVKSLLQDINVQDTTYAPAGDMFELGARIQVVKSGLLFSARANRLYDLYQRHDCLEDIEEPTRRQIEQKYFGRSFAEVWTQTREYHERNYPRALLGIERDPKRKMALVFKRYFADTTRLALQGVESRRVDYQIQCGPALGAFNQWVRGTEIQPWNRRYVADIARRLMEGTAEFLNERFAAYCRA